MCSELRFWTLLEHLDEVSNGKWRNRQLLDGGLFNLHSRESSGRRAVERVRACVCVCGGVQMRAKGTKSGVVTREEESKGGRGGRVSYFREWKPERGASKVEECWGCEYVRGPTAAAATRTTSVG